MYEVTAYRWGDLDGHSYSVGEFKTLEEAQKSCVNEQDYRGGKYSVVAYKDGLPVCQHGFTLRIRNSNRQHKGQHYLETHVPGSIPDIPQIENWEDLLDDNYKSLE
jgi:hypothetical protein